MEFTTLLLVTFAILGGVRPDYWSDRSDFISKESSAAVGASIVLNDKEQQANVKLMDAKLREYDRGFNDPTKFPPSIHFFQSKAAIENSTVFNYIQRVPKGASLHSHDYSLTSFEYLFKLTYRSNLYGCRSDDGTISLYVFENASGVSDGCDWQLLSVLREQDKNFDDYLKSQLSLFVDNPMTVYPDINTVWAKLNDIFSVASPMLSYKPIFQEYFYQALQELYDDNVQYLEFRTTLPELYDDTKRYGPSEVVELYMEVLQQFKNDHPDFSGGRIIYAPVRRVDNSTVDTYVQTMLDLNKKYPDFLAGFDLVGQEDMGEPLVEFIGELQKLSGIVKFFFHAAESNWNGGPTDLNLIDAVLLGTTRIGHGYGLLKHSEVMRIVKEKQIAVELNPISNQVLKLVDDIRDHNGAVLIAQGFPVVISCDDPTYWGAKALSYDWYMAFMGMTARSADLRFLKQIALNSLQFSAMDHDEKDAAMAMWEDKWDRFLDEMLGDK